MSLSRMLAIVAKEWQEILRDRLAFALAFVLAPVLMLVFGVGLTQDVEHVPLAVVDEDRTAASREYVAHFTGSRSFDFRGVLASVHDAERRVADGRLRVLIVIPDRFQERLLRGETAEVQVVLDGTFTTLARTVRAYVDAITRSASLDLEVAHRAMRRLHAEALDARREPVRMEVRYLYNEEVRSIWSVAPGLVMLILTLVVPLLGAVSLVRERESGAIYNIYASTVGRTEFLVGKLVPNAVIGLINAAVLWLIAIGVFQVPFKGSLAFFFAATLVYVVVLSAMGLVIALVAATQQAAVAATIIVMMAVAIQFSGMLTPLSSLTGVTWLLARALPPSHYTTLVHGAFLKGTGLGALWREALVFVVHGAALLTIAVLLFRKRTAA